MSHEVDQVIHTVNGDVTVRAVPQGWNRIQEDLRRGGLIYFYPDGRPEHHMTKAELRASVQPNLDPYRQ